MEINTEKGINNIRRKTRKAIRPGINENNIRLENTLIARPSLLSIEKQNIEESNLSSVFSKKNNFQNERKSKITNENEIETSKLNLSSLSLINKNKFENNNLIKKEFTQDDINENNVQDKNNMIENDYKLDSNVNNCPFLVGSGSEASFEKNNDINNYKDINDLKDDCKYFDEDSSLIDVISNLNSDNSLLSYNTSNDIDELSKLFNSMINKFELFGLDIQSKLEKLEYDLELCIKDTNLNNINGDNQNDLFHKSDRYCELLDLKNRLLKELSHVEDEIIKEEMRIKKEENERLMRIEEYNKTKKIYKDELSSLTIIICWIEDTLQNYLYPLLKKQNEYKQDITRDKEIIELIEDEISKIKKQEKIILEKIREVQEIKRYKGEEKELLEEQIRLSQISKSDKIKNANFKEASLINQTIQVLKQEVVQIEEDYLNVLHQEKEFMEKMERIQKNYMEENKRLKNCKKDIFLNRKLKRQELRLKFQELNNCEFSLNNSDLPNELIKKLSDLSFHLNNQIHSVLDFEIGLINKQDEEDLELNSSRDDHDIKVENQFLYKNNLEETLLNKNFIDKEHDLKQKVLLDNNNEISNLSSDTIIDSNNLVRESNKILEKSDDQALEQNNGQVLKISNNLLLKQNSDQKLKENSDQVLEENNNQVLEQNHHQLLEKSNDQILERNNNRLLEQNNDRLLKQNNDKVIEENSDQVLEQNFYQTLEQNDNQLLEQINHQVLEQSNDQLLNQSND